MKKRQKILALFLAFCVCLAQSPVLSVFATRETAAEQDSTLSLQSAAEEKANFAANARSIDGNILSNEYLELAVNGNGRFTIGTSGGNPDMESDDHKKMLYGHPGPDTSYTTIVIDGTPYKYGDFDYGDDNQGWVSPPIFNDDIKCNTSVAKYGDIEVMQTLKIVDNVSTGRQDVVEINYMVINNGQQSHNIGARIMLDTMLGNNDHAPFRIPGVGAVDTQTEFTRDEDHNDIPQYWQAFDTLTNPSVISQGSFLRSSVNPPDKVQFSSWPQLTLNPWNAGFYPGQPNGDSAVAIFWNEKELRPGRYQTYTTHYGLSELTQDTSGPLGLSLYGDSTISVVNGQYTPNPFDVTAYIENISGRISEIQPADAINPYVYLVVGEGFEIDESTPARVTFDRLVPDEQRQVSWKVKVTGVQQDSVVPIIVVAGADNFEEKQVIKRITIPAAGKNNTLQFGRDNLSFLNDYPYFLYRPSFLWWHGEYEEDYYHISDEYFNLLTRDQGMDQIVTEYVRSGKDKTWGGSCYGMSAVVSLMKDGRLTPSAWQRNASKTHDLKKPVENESVENLINFYHLSYRLPDIQDIQGHNFLLEENVLLQQLVEEVQKVQTGGLPPIFVYYYNYTEDGETKTSGHAITTSAVSEGNFRQNNRSYKYKLTMCDPNYSTPTYLYVEENFTGWFYEKLTDTIVDENGKQNKWVGAVLTELNAIDLINAETRYSRVDMKSYNKNFIHSYTSGSQAISNGAQTAIINGIQPEGDLPVSVIPDLNATADGQNADGQTIFLPDEEAPYTITPAEPGSAIDASIVFTDRVLGQAQSEAGKAVTYDPEGAVSLEDNDGAYTLSLTFNDGNTPLPASTIEVRGDNTSDTALQKTKDGFLLTGDDLDLVEISARNVDEPVAIFDVSTDQDRVLIKSDEDGEIQAYVDNDGDNDFETELEKEIPVAVELDPHVVELKRGETCQITAKTTPAPGATDESLVWTTSDPAVATVDQTGTVIAVTKGEVTITATTVQGNRTDTCTVRVVETSTPKPGKSTRTSSVSPAAPAASLLWDSATIPAGGVSYFTVITDSSEAPKAISANPSVASVSYYDRTALGYRYQVTGVTPGTAVITLQAGSSALPCRFTATVAGTAALRSDTTVDFTLRRGSAYCFKFTLPDSSAALPSFTVGNGGVLKTQFVARVGNECYFRVWAVGAPGQRTGVYTQTPGELPIKHCTVTVS